MSTQKTRKHEKIQVPSEIALRSSVDLGEVLRKLKQEVEKGNIKYYTPYTLAATYGISLGDAKRVLNEAVKQNILKLHSSGRRAKIYIPQ
ncbi:MAG: 30S ribosomal protein S25e [Desulfurococcaceae archaeon]